MSSLRSAAAESDATPMSYVPPSPAHAIVGCFSSFNAATTETPVANDDALANVAASVGTPYELVGNAPAVTIAHAAGITRYGRFAPRTSSSHCRPMDMPQ